MAMRSNADGPSPDDAKYHAPRLRKSEPSKMINEAHAGVYNMLKRLLFAAVFLGSGTVIAQSVDVKSIDADTDEATTVEIRKGKAAATAQNTWEISDGNSDVQGEPSATAKEARTSWSKACEGWKKDFRSDNKENKIINLNCGTPVCEGEVGSKLCTSKASYRIKTKVN